MQGYIFYSNKCKHCANLIGIIKNNKIEKLFKYECIDQLTEKELLSRQLITVPTLVIISAHNKNNSSNNSRGLYAGINAFDWIDSFIKNIKSANNDTDNSIVSNVRNTKQNIRDLSGFSLNEHCGVSDNYAFCSDKIDMAQPKNYCEPRVTENIVTIPIGDMKKYKEKYCIGNENTQTLLNNVVEKRNKQTDLIREIMEKKQIELITSQL